MSGGKHTPGPWIASEPRITSNFGSYRASIRAILTDETGKFNSFCAQALGGHLDDVDVCKANASLIAAAPTMHDGIILAAGRIAKVMDQLEPHTPMWLDLQRALFGLYEALPKEGQ